MKKIKSNGLLRREGDTLDILAKKDFYHGKILKLLYGLESLPHDKDFLSVLELVGHGNLSTDTLAMIYKQYLKIRAKNDSC